jgi:hypothetical protein
VDKIVSSVVARASPPAINGRHRLYSINMAQDIVHCIARWMNDSKPSCLAGQAGLGPSLYLKVCMAPQSQSPYPFASNANFSRPLRRFLFLSLVKEREPRVFRGWPNIIRHIWLRYYFPYQFSKTHAYMIG